MLDLAVGSDAGACPPWRPTQHLQHYTYYLEYMLKMYAECVSLLCSCYVKGKILFEASMYRCTEIIMQAHVQRSLLYELRQAVSFCALHTWPKAANRN